MKKSTFCKVKRRIRAQRLPEEILHEILVRVPSNSLVKCLAVCKSWNSLVKSSDFILDHIKSNNKSDSLLLLSCGHNKDQFILLDWDNIDDECTDHRVIPTSNLRGAFYSIYRREEPYLLHLVGTCNGLICLYFWHQLMIQLVLWNPCVRKFLILPGPRFHPQFSDCCPVYEFGYDSLTNDYKVVQIWNGIVDKRSICSVEVFSLLRGSWKTLNPPADLTPRIYDEINVEVNGNLHWICFGSDREIDERRVIMTLNLSSEVFGKMKFPESLRKDSPRETVCYSMKYKDYYALLSISTHFSAESFDLWAMNEYGVAESWTKLLTIPVPDNSPYWALYPLYFTKTDKVINGTIDHDLVLTDLEDDQSKVIIHSNLGPLGILSIDPFFESLVFLDRSDASSY